MTTYVLIALVMGSPVETNMAYKLESDCLKAADDLQRSSEYQIETTTLLTKIEPVKYACIFRKQK